MTAIAPLRQTVLPPSRAVVPVRGRQAVQALPIALEALRPAAPGSGHLSAYGGPAERQIRRGLLLDLLV